MSKIALAQLNPTIGDFEANFNKAQEAIKKAKENSCDLIIFSELFLTGYPPLDLIFKHGFFDQQEKVLKKLCKETQGNNFGIVIGGIAKSNKNSKRFHNSAFCIADAKIQKIVSKTLLPSYDVFDETRYFEASRDHDCTWKHQGIKLGISICEDAWIEAHPSLYTKNPIEGLVANSADIIVNISASPFTLNKIARRYELVAKIAKKYQTKFIYLNQVGANDQLVFDGSSFVCDELGERILSLKSFEEDLKYFEPDASSHETKSENSQIQNIYKACVLGIKDYIKKTGFKKVVLGLSGGIDSAVVACLASEALGPKNVHAIMMPSIYTSDASISDAQALAKTLNLNYETKSINSLYELTKSTFAEELKGLADENIQPRIRANILMAFSNSNDAILLATGNKSEIAVGYSTLYGDSCGAIAPIGDLLKTQVYELAQYINREKEIIPASIITKAPSAELRPDQKDSDSLPDYELLDKIIHHYVDELKSSQEIIDLGFDNQITKRILSLIDRAEYKRTQMPPIIKIANKAFGIGRRMPIAQNYSHA